MRPVKPGEENFMVNFKDIHAVVVEDDTPSADVLTDLLRQLEINYTVLLDGSSIIAAMHQFGRVDVVFLDLEMPNSTGYQVLADIQALPDFAGIPVVAYTSHTSEMSNARKAGFHSFLGKPLRGKVFANLLAKILDREPVWDVR
jgi:CheY-like chemotaxis protein